MKNKTSFNRYIKTAEQLTWVQYSDGTLAVDGSAVTFDTARRVLGGLHQRPVYQLCIIWCGTI